MKPGQSESEISVRRFCCQSATTQYCVSLIVRKVLRWAAKNCNDFERLLRVVLLIIAGMRLELVPTRNQSCGFTGGQTDQILRGAMNRITTCLRLNIFIFLSWVHKYMIRSFIIECSTAQEVFFSLRSS